ncbi:uncharacterized protein LOC108736689 [Agrilus planipennis]|uniref:Uncharacterized protein LOC108736689 n=1 Tax=Agrilus planipennis TaxID=224129 RepID=A0A1W4WW30_AGRPL|nr:uncharacterized protein LOC108736689 [Agrilus planipennis]
MKKIIENTNVTDVRLNNNDLRNTTFTKYILLVPFLINSIYWVIVTPFLNYQHTGRTYISVINKTEEMINCLLMELNLVINHRLKYQLRTINYRLKKDIEYVTFIKKQFKEGILQIEDLNDKIDIKINDIKQQLHLRWCVNKTSMDTKKAFEIGIIATLAVATCSLTVVIDYGLYLSLFNTFSWRIFFKLIGLLTELTKDMAVLMVIISSWTMIEKEATETGPLIHEFWNSVIDLESSTKSAEFLKLASLHIIYTTPSFSILNILQLNWDAMSAIVNIAVTYSTSFLQLQLNAMRNRKNLL